MNAYMLHGLAAQARAHERLGDNTGALRLLQAAAAAAAPHPAEARALLQRAAALAAHP